MAAPLIAITGLIYAYVAADLAWQGKHGLALPREVRVLEHRALPRSERNTMTTQQIDVAELRRLWDAEWPVPDLAARYGCSETYIYWLRKKHNFGDRSQSKEPPPPSCEDATASSDSLALSPWVAARAAEFRRGKEERGESVYPGVHLRTYSARSLRLIPD